MVFVWEVWILQAHDCDGEQQAAESSNPTLALQVTQGRSLQKRCNSLGGVVFVVVSSVPKEDFSGQRGK